MIFLGASNDLLLADDREEAWLDVDARVYVPDGATVAIAVVGNVAGRTSSGLKI